MLPPPSPAGQSPTPNKQRAGFAVLVVALVVLLGLVALVWWVNEQDNDDDPWRTGAEAPVLLMGPPT